MGILLLIAVFFLIKLPHSQVKLSLCLLFLGSTLSVIINYPSGLIILAYLLAIAAPKNTNQTKMSSTNQALVKNNLGAIIVRLISPALAGTAMLYYGVLNFQSQLTIPRVINHLSEGRIYPAWLKLKQESSIPALKLENLYYQFRISLLAGKKTPEVTFFENNLSAWVDVSYQLSLLFLEKKKYQKALFFIEKSIDYHPLWAKNYFLKADILQKMKRTEPAKEALNKAKKLDRYNTNFRTNN